MKGLNSTANNITAYQNKAQHKIQTPKMNITKPNIPSKITRYTQKQKNVTQNQQKSQSTKTDQEIIAIMELSQK